MFFNGYWVLDNLVGMKFSSKFDRKTTKSTIVHCMYIVAYFNKEHECYQSYSTNTTLFAILIFANKLDKVCQQPV